LIAGHLGGRLYMLAETGGPWTLGALVAPGYRHPGAIAALLIALPVMRRVLLPGVSLGLLGDCIAPAIAFASVVMRVGCFGIGCCFGAVSGLPWALRFPPDSLPSDTHARLGLLPSSHVESLAVHPLQLYFLALSLGVGFVCLWLMRHKRYDGQVLLWFLALHESGKFLLEFLRQDVTQRGAPLSVPLISLAIAVVAGAVLFGRAYHARRALRPLAVG
jgi:phosphatidylglycerol:prolipoprotein diacylglycerol transferase